MPSPFPGMNPYLEQKGLWRDFHGSFLLTLRTVLTPQVVPRYYVELEESLYLDRGDDRRGLFAVADAAATKVFSTERIQEVGRLAEEVVGRYGNPADAHTGRLLDWLDKMTKRNLVITFGGGVNEVMREMIAASGLKVPRVTR